METHLRGTSQQDCAGDSLAQDFGSLTDSRSLSGAGWDYSPSGWAARVISAMLA